MKITPKHMAYGAVLSIGAIALAIDQVVPPSTAAAASSTPASATAAVLASAAEAYTPLDAGLAPLADRLAQINAIQADPASPVRDAFAIDRKVWGLDQEQVVESLPSPWEQADKLKVTLALPNQFDPLAVVDGKVVRPGDYLPSGHRVQSIRPNSVVLDLDGQLITVAVERPAVTGRN